MRTTSIYHHTAILIYQKYMKVHQILATRQNPFRAAYINRWTVLVFHMTRQPHSWKFTYFS